jgi:hypothetical protein
LSERPPRAVPDRVLVHLQHGPIGSIRHQTNAR